MHTFMDDYPIGMVRIGFSTPEERAQYEADKIATNKMISRINSRAAQKAKRDTCILCGNACTSFCNSHSVPKFTLRRIAESGKVISPIQGEVPWLGNDFGVNKAGVFNLICNDCDNTVFQQYESPTAYDLLPSHQMLAQIAVKNLLQIISKRYLERAIYDLVGEMNPFAKDFTDEKIDIGEYDLHNYQQGLAYAQKALSDQKRKRYHLCFFRILDYVVPYAAQASIDMVCDFEDTVINDVYRFDSNYRIKDIHVAVFPLEKTSVVLMFIEEGDARYRKFYRQLRRLSEEDQLAAINYIVFAYTENVFLQPSTFQKVKQNSSFMDVCKKVTDYLAMFPVAGADPLVAAVKEFSLSRRSEIPNLLSREYAIDT